MPMGSVLQKSRGELLLGLVGLGIEESRSSALHECNAAENGPPCLYQLTDRETMEIGRDAFPLLLTAQPTGFAGLSINCLYKQLVPSALDEFSQDAHASGAAHSTVSHEGKRSGHNTDWIGLRLRESMNSSAGSHSIGKLSGQVDL